MYCPCGRFGNAGVTYLDCRHCGSYLSARTVTYDDTYWATRGTLEGHAALVKSDRLEWWREHIKPYLRSMSRVLEIGCAPGVLMESLASDGHIVRGIDPTMPATNTVLKGSFPDTSWDMNFDAVIMFDVLEHLDDPKAALRKAKQLLTHEHGFLILQVPTIRDSKPPDRFFAEGEHTWIPTQKALNDVLEACGFEIISDTTAWCPGHEVTVARG